MNKIILIVITVALAGGFALYANRDAMNPTVESTPEVIVVPQPSQPTETAETTEEMNTDEPATTTEVKVEVSAAVTPPAQTHTIVYTSTGYSPANLTINKGDTIIFKAEVGNVWTASNDHPSHTTYPEFDQRSTSAAGESWSFRFDRAGVWGYHDHRNANNGGTITVR